MPFLTQRPDGSVVLRLHVQPKASKSLVVGLYDGCLKIAIAAPPVDGKANSEVEKFLATILGVPKRAVVLKSGAQSRRKQVVVTSLKEKEVRRVFEKILGNGS